ncbi:MAG: prolin-rich transrane protein, partial [Ramlibacter sp.]|nr:prolin-rich transrane protein [Ramlibacter sp.]
PALLRVELERFPRVEPDVGIEEAASHSFAAMSWHVAPPPPPPAPAVKPEPPPPPTAPPMPFTYMGRYEDGAEKVILLVRGDRVYTVSVGEVIEDTYRIERLGERQLELTYLPLGTLQTISTGGT